MELLVILLGEFLFFPVIAAIGAFINVCFSLLSVLVEFFLCVISGRKSESGPPTSKTMSHARNRSFSFNFLAKFSGLTCACIFIAFVLVNTVLFSPAMSMIASHISKKTGADISYSSVGGNVFTGAFQFKNLKVIKNTNDGFRFDLNTQDVSLDIDIYSLLSSTIVIEALHVNNVRGEIEDVRQARKYKASDDRQVNEDEPKRLKAKKAFVINNLALKNLNFILLKDGVEPLDVSVSVLESAPFRSRYAIFDTFFRSKVTADVNGHDLLIASYAVDGGRETSWHLDHFPVSLVGKYLDKAPLNWFESGVIDVRVIDSWRYDKNADIDMDWSFVLKDVHMRVPEDASLLTKATMMPVMAYINRREDDLDVGFSLVMNEQQFEGALSLDAAGLWDAALEGMSKKLTDMSDEKTEKIKDGVNEGIDRFKNFLNKKRKQGE